MTRALRSRRRLLLSTAFLVAGCRSGTPSSPSTIVPLASSPSEEETLAGEGRARTRDRWREPRDCSIYSSVSDNKPDKRFECDLQETLREFVVERQSCSSVADCVVLDTQCPFGCGIPVARDHAAAVDAKHRDLTERYNAAGVDCKYKCSPPAGAVCESGRCRKPCDRLGGCR